MTQAYKSPLEPLNDEFQIDDDLIDVGPAPEAAAADEPIDPPLDGDRIRFEPDLTGEAEAREGLDAYSGEAPVQASSGPVESAPAEDWDEPIAKVEVLPGAGREVALAVQPQTSGAGFNPVGDLLSETEAALGEVSIPRIAIHVFGERTDTMEAAERAAADRRLSRATTLVRPGGLAGAVTAYQSEPTPSLIIVECASPAPVLIADLERLAEVCDPGSKVVVVGAANDIALYRELMRRGVSEYVVAPVSPLQLISVIGALYSDPHAPFLGRSIAFVGARGGVGSSTVAHNTAFTITERLASNAVVVDYDLPFGTAGLDFNQDPVQGVADALSQPDRLDPVLLDRMMVRCSERLSLFAAPATLDADWEITPDAVDEVTQRIRTTAPYVVLDLPHVWSKWVRRMLVSSDEVVIVAAPDLASLRNAKNMVDLIRGARPNDAPPRLVLNQVGVPGRPEIPIRDFCNALGLPATLVLPFDPKLYGLASNNGQMILEVGAKSKSAEGFQHLAHVVTNRDVPLLPAPASMKKSLLDKLLKR